MIMLSINAIREILNAALRR